MQAISLMLKPASSLCNMHCDYCFYCDEASKRAVPSYGFMSEETLRLLIKKTLPQTTEHYALAFQGGEPTLRGLDFYRTAVQMLRHYNRNHARIHLAMQTNGVSMTEEWAEFFWENSFLIGLSVDGTSELHDAYRHLSGSSSYASALHAARLLDQAKVPYNILTVVHQETAKKIRSIYQSYRARNWRYLQFIACLDPLEEKRGTSRYSLTPASYGAFLTDLFDVWYQDARKGKEPYIRQFDNWLGILMGEPPEACEQCGVCGMQYVVEANGSVYPCDFYAVDAWCLGNITEDSLEAIDLKRNKLSFQERSRYIPEKCRACPWLMLCRNGCYRTRVTEAGGDGVSFFCEAYQAFFTVCGERMVSLAAARKRGNQFGK